MVEPSLLPQKTALQVIFLIYLNSSAHPTALWILSFLSTLDTVAPLLLRKIKEKSPTPWYNEHTRALKRAARKIKHSWRKTKLEVFRMAWQEYPILQKSIKKLLDLITFRLF